MRFKFLLVASLLLIPYYCIAATGDVLWQTKFDKGVSSDPKSVISADGGIIWSLTNFNTYTSSPQTGGHDNGPYLRLSIPSATSDYIGAGFSSVHFQPKSEATFVYWERYQDLNTTSWNNKGSRIRDTANNYYAAIMSHWNLSYDSCLLPGCSTTGPAFYMSNSSAGTGGPTSWLLTPSNAVTSIDANTGYCTDIGGGKFSCPGRLAIHWTTDNGATKGFGQNKWHKIRLYTKVPSSSTATDGKIMLWIDEVLIYTLENVKSLTGGNLLSHIEFYPSATNNNSFVHDYDDITIYEGYVPPSNQQTSAPKGLIIKSVQL